MYSVIIILMTFSSLEAMKKSTSITLEEVLKCLSQYGIRVKEDKCAFLQDKVEYLRRSSNFI